jgi:hypothetical protein|tara:strand:- start:974 stop:1099 length:126 start_codon:yes stop_codon:yes gene_type:complete
MFVASIAPKNKQTEIPELSLRVYNYFKEAVASYIMSKTDKD